MNARIGLGLMGVHEWLMRRGYLYGMNPELAKWMQAYKEISDNVVSAAGRRAIAPTGTIGILAGTTTGIEPLFALAYKRRYLSDGHRWKAEYVVESTAEYLINLGIEPGSIETSMSLAADVERRLKFQADMQEYVDQGISSTINMPAWGTPLNNEETLPAYTALIRKYAPRLRGVTFYPDGARGGQPLTPVEYEVAKHHQGVIYDETDICAFSGHGGVCGV
jgi:ribonucleoside-diphosphate reductase alpha chain